VLLENRRANQFQRSINYVPRMNSRGEVIQVTRRPVARRTIKPDVWKYHLRQMAISDDPVAYLCRFLPAPIQTRAVASGEELNSVQA
jgi:hypothetical protein